jgi:hypothetical protein
MTAKNHVILVLVGIRIPFAFVDTFLAHDLQLLPLNRLTVSFDLEDAMTAG